MTAPKALRASRSSQGDLAFRRRSCCHRSVLCEWRENYRATDHPRTSFSTECKAKFKRCENLSKMREKYGCASVCFLDDTQMIAISYALIQSIKSISAYKHSLLSSVACSHDVVLIELKLLRQDLYRRRQPNSWIIKARTHKRQREHCGLWRSTWACQGL